MLKLILFYFKSNQQTIGITNDFDITQHEIQIF